MVRHLFKIRSLVLGLLVTTAAWSNEPKREIYVVNTETPAISIVDKTTWTKIGDILLDPEPTYSIISRDNHYLYVLHSGQLRSDGTLQEGLSTLSIADLEKREVVKKIPLAWNTTSMTMSGNGQYIICVSQGKIGKKKTPEEYGSVFVIDTQKNDVVATLPAGRLGIEVAIAAELSRIFVLSFGESPKKKEAPYIKPKVTIFDINQEKPLADIEFERAKKIALSQNNKWLYVLDPGTPSKKPKEHKNGIVHVIDVEAAQLVSAHEVGTMPYELIIDPKADDVLVLAQTTYKDRHGLVYRLHGNQKPEAIGTGMNLRFVSRFEDQPGFYAFANEDMRFLPDHDSTSTSLVPLNPKKSKQPDIKKLDGNPGEVFYLPNQKKMVMTICKENGEPTSKVAIVNLAENRVEYVIKTGRGGIKFGKFMGSMTLSVAATTLSYYGGYASAQATGSPFFFYNTYWFGPAAPNLELTSSADGKYVYSLNTQTNDITIINSQDGTVLDKIAVGGGCRRIGLTPGGRFIYSHTDGQIDLIDTQTNKKFLEHHVQDGTIKSLHLLEADRRMVALTSKALLVWDVEKGTLENTVVGFAGPYLLVEPY